MLKKLSLLILTIALLSLALPAKADTIEIDTEARTLTYRDTVDIGYEIVKIEKTYPIVSPKPTSLHKYHGETEFNVKGLVINPTWISPTGEIYAKGRSPLGAVRINFLNSNGIVCSIHGTDKPWLVGKASVTNCCIRMKNPDILELLRNVSYDTKIIIKY